MTFSIHSAPGISSEVEPVYVPVHDNCLLSFHRWLISDFGPCENSENEKGEFRAFRVSFWI